MKKFQQFFDRTYARTIRRLRSKKILNACCLLLVAILLLVMTSLNVDAKNTDSPAKSSEQPSDNDMVSSNSDVKTEAVFGLLSEEGAVSSLYVINQFEQLDAKTKDYGDYSEIKSLNEQKLTYSDGAVDLPASPERYWYQGNLQSKEIPWNFTFKYELNGEEVTADKLSGASGKLKITFTIDKNESYKDPAQEGQQYFDNYAVQVRIPFDPDRCSNISAPASIIALEGKDISATYTILSQTEERTYTASAEVNDFAMDRIRISAIPLNFFGSLPDTDEFTDPLGQLESGIAELASSTDQLLAAQKPLLEGSEKVNAGNAELQEANRQLLLGMQTYSDKLKLLTDNLPNVAGGIDTLASSIDQLNQGMHTYAQGFAQVAEATPQLQQGNQTFATALEEIADKLPNKDNKDPGDGNESKPDNPGADTNQNPQQLVEAIAKLKDGLKSYVDGVDKATQGMAALMPTLKSISEQLQQMASAVNPPLDADSWCEQLQIDPAKRTDPDIVKVIDALIEEQTAHYRQSQTVLAVAGFIDQMVAEWEKQTANNGTDALKESGVQLISALDKIDEGVKTLVDQLGSGQTGMEQLFAGIKQLSTQYQAYSKGLGEYFDGVNNLHKVYDTEIMAGMDKLSTGAKNFSDQMSGVGTVGQKLSEGFDTLVANFDLLTQNKLKFAHGVEDLTKGFSEYLYGVSRLAHGNQELNRQTQGMTSRMEEEIAEHLKSYQNSDYRPLSFTSTKNKNIKSVQFVFFVPAINGEKIGVSSSQ